MIFLNSLIFQSTYLRFIIFFMVYFIIYSWNLGKRYHTSASTCKIYSEKDNLKNKGS